MIHVTEPFAEPRIHRAFPGGLDDLEKYRAEVLYGVHDHWIDPAAGKWEYTYHERLFAYRVPGGGRVRPDRRRHRQAQGSPAHPAGPGGDLAGVERHEHRRPGLPAAAVVPHLRRQAAHERPHALQRRLQGRVHEHVRLHRAAGGGGRRPSASSPASTSTSPTRSTSTAATSASSRASSRSSPARSAEDRVYTSDFARDFFLEGCDSLLAEPDMPEDKKAVVRKRRAELAAM